MSKLAVVHGFACKPQTDGDVGYMELLISDELTVGENKVLDPPLNVQCRSDVLGSTKKAPIVDDGGSDISG